MSNLTHRLASAFAPVRRSLGVGVFAAVLFAVGSTKAEITSESYVESGLIAQWDAIDNAVDANGKRCHEESPAAWRELVNDAQVTHTGSLIYDDAGVKFDGTADLSANIPAVLDALASKSFTVQLCVNIASYTQNGGILNIGSGPDCRELILDQRQDGGLSSVNGSSVKGAFSGLQYASAGWNKACVVDYNTGKLFNQCLQITITVDTKGAHLYLGDGSVLIYTTPANGLSPTSDLVTLGYYIGGTRAKFTLHSARFYDRVLTPREIAYNAGVDEVRFMGRDEPKTLDPENFRYNLEITPAAGRVTKIVEDNIPLLVRLSSARQSGFDPTTCGENGSGLRFMLENGRLLSHEVDYWSTTGEDCCVWVNVPVLAADTKIYACWHPLDGQPLPTVNPADAWPRHVGVWHLSEPTGAAIDSSGNGYTTTNAPTSLATTDSKVGLARDVDRQQFKTGVTDLLTAEGKKNIAVVNQFTCSGWMYVDRLESESSTKLYEALFYKGGYKLNGWYQCVQDYPNKFSMCGGSPSGASNVGTATLSSSMQGRWVYLTAVYGASANALYANGVNLKLTANVAATASDHELTFLSSLRGKADELRIRDGAVSAEWVQADYATQNDAAFLNYGLTVNRSFVLDDIPTQWMGDSGAATPIPTVRSRATGEPIDSQNFTFGYEDNDKVGWATVTVTGKDGTSYAGESVSERFYVLNKNYNSQTYVANGLTAHWDGYENAGVGQHSESPTSWADLCGGEGWLLTANGSWEDGAFVCSGNGYAATIGAAQNDVYTVEICFMPDFSGGDVIKTIWSSGQGTSGSGAIAHVLLNGTTLEAARIAAGAAKGIAAGALIADEAQTLASTYTVLNHISTTPNEVFFNGERKPLTANAGYNNSGMQYCTLGGRGSGADRDYKGKIHSVRLYNRVLTAAEIAYNAALDAVRFNGADPDEAFKTCGVRLRPDGRFEHLLSVHAGSNGLVRVTANGETTAAAALAEVWATSGTVMRVEYIPNVASEWRFLSGCPSDMEFISPLVVSFAMPAEKWVVEAIPFAYADENIVSSDPAVQVKTPYDGRCVYVFTNVAAGLTTTFLKRPMLLDDALVVAGGGSGLGCNSSTYAGGGGGGGVIHQEFGSALPLGARLFSTVGAGGRTSGGKSASGENSVLRVGETTLAAIGGGGSGQAGGSGGGGGGTAGYAGTPGQGFAGGANCGIKNVGGGGGGGGAMQGGGDSYALNGKSVAGKGGDGRWDKITGENHCYGSGGGGQNTSGSATYDPETQIPYFGEGGADSGGRGGISYLISGIVEWNYDWYNGMPGVDGLGGGGGSGYYSSSATAYHGGNGGSGTIILGFSSIGDTSRTLEFEDIDAYPLVEGVAAPDPRVSCGGKTLVKGTDYDLFYENHTQVGVGSFVIVGKGEYAGLTRRHAYRVNATHFVSPDGDGDGSDWAHAMNITNAVNGLTNGTYEIWCKAGTYDLSGLSADMYLRTYTAIRGGFAGDPEDAAKKASNGEKTIFDGGNVIDQIFSSVYACDALYFETRPVVFEDCVFQGAKMYDVVVWEKATPVNFIRCTFRNNYTDSTTQKGGSAFYGYSCANAPVSFTDCRFDGNVFYNGPGKKTAIYVHTVKLSIEGCSFVTNGVPYDQQTDWNRRTGGNDGVIYCENCTVTMKDCDFRGNFLWRGSGTSRLIEVNGKSTAIIEHCRFVGNSFYGTKNASESAAAILYLAPNANYTHVARNCTFAYNTMDCLSDGCSIIKAANDAANKKVLVENCIFGENICSTNNAATRDLAVGTAGGTTIRYSLFEGFDTNKYVNVELDDTNVAGAPRFLANKKVTAFLKPGLDEGRLALDPAKIDEILAINVHLKRFSPAVNTGNPASDYSQEPKPNGKRINMGAYGGTAEAACTAPGGALIIR